MATKINVKQIKDLQTNLDSKATAYSAASDPLVTHDAANGYLVDDTWRNTASKRMSVCTDNTTGAAVWEGMTGFMVSAIATGDGQTVFNFAGATFSTELLIVVNGMATTDFSKTGAGQITLDNGVNTGTVVIAGSFGIGEGVTSGSLTDADLFAMAYAGQNYTAATAHLSSHMSGIDDELGTQRQKQIVMPLPLSGVTDNQLNLMGANREFATAQTGDYSTVTGIGNQHIGILMNSSTGGDIILTGIAANETTGLPTAGETETITTDTTAGQLYQSARKFYELTSVNGVGITTKNYDLSALGYFDMGNKDWVIEGYRLDIKTAGDTSDIGIHLIKVQDDGNKKSSLVTIENYGHDSTSGGGSYIDDLRTGADLRTVAMNANLAPNNSEICYKQLDFDDYFSSDENILEGSKDEGLIIHYEGKPSAGISQIDHVTLTLFYRMGG